jgi:hypothetical protein
MKKYVLFLFFATVFLNKQICAQIAVNTDGSPANGSAMLDVKSNNKGVLIPRVSTTDRLAITSPATGLFVFDSTEKTLYMFDGIQWRGFAALTDLERPVNNFTTGPDKQDTTLTGYSVAMWDQFMAIGAPYVTTNNTPYTGAVYIYRNTGSNWQYITTLTPTGNCSGALFGISVSLKGSYLIVGAPNQQDGSFSQVGAAYIYYYNGVSWNSLQTIFGPSTGIGYAQVVAINQFGTYAAVSASSATVSSNSGAGVVYIYNKPSSTFIFQTYINDASPVANEAFGTAMAINPGGNNIVVGAPSKLVGGHYGDGYVGQFDRSGTTWTQTHTYTPLPDDYLGIGAQVDIDDNYVIFTVAKTKTVDYLTIGWAGFNITMTDNVNSIALDPTTDHAFIFAGSSVYANGGGSNVTLLKTLALNPASLNETQLVGVYNKNYVIGLPIYVTTAQPYEGAFYTATDPY